MECGNEKRRGFGNVEKRGEGDRLVVELPDLSIYCRKSWLASSSRIIWTNTAVPYLYRSALPCSPDEGSSHVSRPDILVCFSGASAKSQSRFYDPLASSSNS